MHMNLKRGDEIKKSVEVFRASELREGGGRNCRKNGNAGRVQKRGEMGAYDLDTRQEREREEENRNVPSK